METIDRDLLEGCNFSTTNDSRLTGIIHSIQRFSIHNGPGIRTTIFFKGCPLRCLWCANPDTQLKEPEVLVQQELCLSECSKCILQCPKGALYRCSTGSIMIKSELCSGCGICEKVCPTGAIRIIGRKVEVREVLDQIIRDVTFYRMSGGGITLSGGEPLFQADFALAIVKSCRELGIHTVLDTSGISEWNNLKMIAENVNIVFLDIKLMDKKKHEIYTGLSAEVVQKNALRLSEAGIPIVVRVPIIPEINDDCDNIVRLGEFVRELKSMERIDLLPYHRLGTEKYVKLGRSYQLEHIPVPSSEQMYKIATLLRKFVENVKVVY